MCCLCWYNSMCWRQYIFTSQNTMVAVVWICIQNHYTGGNCYSLCTGKQKQWLLKKNAAWDYWRLFDIKDPRSKAKVKQKRNTHGFNSTHPLTDVDRYLWDKAFQWLIGAAGNKNVGGIAHWLTNEIFSLNQEPSTTGKTFQVAFYWEQDTIQRPGKSRL